VDRHLSELSVHGPLAGAAGITALARIILEVAAQGHCVVLGRGAGCLLPPQAKLYVRLIAPEKDRIAYISQVERLSWTDAEKFVRERDKARHQFITKRFGRAPTDVLQYDLVLNTALLGVEASSEIIAAAANAKQFRA
jgi:cytidylate kinase